MTDPRRGARVTTQRRRHGRMIAALLSVTIAAGITTSLSGCSFFGETVNKQFSAQDNLANQREAAIDFIGVHPEVNAITFTKEGGVSGSGTWAANALVSVGGTQYQAILGLGVGSTSWQPWPSQSATTTPSPVTLTYSDGTSEELK